jgi:hypothetical protein
VSEKLKIFDIFGVGGTFFTEVAFTAVLLALSLQYT